jgi:hypothetical protein
MVLVVGATKMQLGFVIARAPLHPFPAPRTPSGPHRPLILSRHA